jgi:Family of unknown function (DUF6353)
MNLGDLAAKAIFHLKKNSPTLLTVAAVGGVGLTAYFTAKGTIKAAEAIYDHEQRNGIPDSPREHAKAHIQVAYKHYIPAALTAGATVVCIVAANRVGLRRAAAAQASLLIAERGYSEYRQKIAEEFGKRKDDTIREEIAKDRVRSIEPPSQEVLLTGPGNILSMELHTGRYFACDMETLRRAQNTLNERLIRHDYASLDDFYYIIGLRPTAHSSEIGWKSSKMMELEFTTVLSNDGRPCLAFDYNYTKPLYEGNQS